MKFCLSPKQCGWENAKELRAKTKSITERAINWSDWSLASTDSLVYIWTVGYCTLLTFNSVCPMGPNNSYTCTCEDTVVNTTNSCQVVSMLLVPPPGMKLFLRKQLLKLNLSGIISGFFWPHNGKSSSLDWTLKKNKKSSSLKALPFVSLNFV